MSVKKNKWILVGVAIVAIFLLSACSGPDEHIWLKSPGWTGQEQKMHRRRTHELY